MRKVRKIGHAFRRRQVTRVDSQPVIRARSEQGQKQAPATALASRTTSAIATEAGNSLTVFSTPAFDALKTCVHAVHATEDHTEKLLAACPLTAEGIDNSVQQLAGHYENLQELLLRLGQEAETVAADFPDSRETLLARQLENDLRKQLAAIEDRIRILTVRRDSHPGSVHHLLKSRLNHIATATNSVIMALEKPDIPSSRERALESLLTRLLDKQTELSTSLASASRSAPASQKDIVRLKQFPRRLVHLLQEHGVGADLNSHKHALADAANRRHWDISESPIHFQYKGGYHRFTETVTPASKLELPDEWQGRKTAQGIFVSPYQTEGISSHSTRETSHAVNLNTSCLKNDKGEVIFQAVRHAVHCPYGHPADSQARTIGAFRRAEESAVAALTLHPEKMKTALNGEEVELVLTSSSLLTPDVFRHAAGSSEGDEQAMLQAQVAAWQMLNERKTLPVRLPSGEVREVKVKIHALPFNFGLNMFAQGATAPVTGGWGASDAINNEGLNLLIGPMTDGTSVHGGLAGSYLAKLQKEDPVHPDIQIIGELVAQIREIYSHNRHHSTEGGAAKLASRVMVLTHLIGGTPLVNCKSAKDRTAMAMADAEWLMTRIRLNGAVPDPQSISPADKQLFLEFAVQGNHLRIQEMNSGSPGFKVDKVILESYIDRPEDLEYLRGLSEAVLA
ncbi:MAG: inositol phosphate phosphatase SopB [Endozoicomonas sp.]